MQIRYVLWCGKTVLPPCPTWENLDPMAAFTINDTSTTRWHQVGSFKEGPRSTANGSKTRQDLQKNQVVANHFIDVHRLMALILSGQVTKVSPSTRLFKLMMPKSGFEFSSFWEDTYSTCSRGWSPGKGGRLAPALLLKGVTKAPSCMRNVLLWKSRKYDSNICSRCMTSKFRMFNLCVLKRIQWSAQSREVSWTSCSMLGGLSLAQSWYFYMFGPKWCVECSNVTAFLIQLVQSNQQVPPHPKIRKSARECTMTQIPCEVFPSHAAVFPSSPSKFPPQFQK